MKVKVFEKNEKGKIEFTRKELEALLNEVYNDGHSDGYEAGRNSKTYTWTSPSWSYLSDSKPYNSPSITTSDLTCTGSDLLDNTLKISYGEHSINAVSTY